MQMDKEQLPDTKETAGIRLYAGRFELLRELGRSRSSIVYEAKEHLLDRRVAVKLVELDQENIARSEKQKEKFRGEARLSSSLKHPNIVAIYSFGEAENNTAYLCMELLEGETLEAALQKEDFLKQDNFKQVFEQVIDALAFAHQSGVIHRDIKAANIFVSKNTDLENKSENLQVKVLDFGISCWLECNDQNLPKGTLTELAAGTCTYMSPEQCLGKNCDQRSDMYSLACLIFEVLSGQAPFEGESSAALMYKHVNEKAPELKAEMLKFELSDGFISLINACLEKDPNLRPESMLALKQALQQNHSESSSAKKQQLFSPLPVIVAAIIFAVLIFLTMQTIETWKLQNQSTVKMKSDFKNSYNIGQTMKEAQILSRQGNRAEAIQLLKTAIERGDKGYANQKRWRDLHEVLAVELSKQENYDEARKYFEQAASLTEKLGLPLPASMLKYYFVCLLKSGQEKHADLIFEKELNASKAKLKADDPAVAYKELADLEHVIGFAHHKLNRYKQAEIHLKKALNYYDSCQYKRNYQGAIESLKLYLNCEFELQGKKLPADMEAELKKTGKDLLEANPGDAEATYALASFAEFCRDLHKYKEAISLYKLAVTNAERLPEGSILPEQIKGWQDQFVDLEKKNKH